MARKGPHRLHRREHLSPGCHPPGARLRLRTPRQSPSAQFLRAWLRVPARHHLPPHLQASVLPTLQAVSLTPHLLTASLFYFLVFLTRRKRSGEDHTEPESGGGGGELAVPPQNTPVLPPLPSAPAGQGDPPKVPTDLNSLPLKTPQRCPSAEKVTFWLWVWYSRSF